jgi:hypothetical protein
VCKICLTDIDFDTNLNPLDCGHAFHGECLEEYLNGKIFEKSFPLICPEEECKALIHPTDLKARISEENFTKFDEFTLKDLVEKNPEVYSCCPTPNCPFMFEFDNSEGNDFRC